MDKPAVRKLYQDLRNDGIRPWFDEVDLLPGQQWETEISKAVRSSSAVVVCLSRNSVEKTGYVHREIKFALDAADERPEGSNFVIPARLEQCSVPERLRHLHWVDLFETTGYERLVKALTIQGTHSPCPSPSPKLRFTVHRAFFLPDGPECLFLNAVNLTDADLEVTHIWMATTPEIHVTLKDRPLPKRLKPQEAWETWVPVDRVPDVDHDSIFQMGKARLSTGEVICSQRNDDVPNQGFIPGGPITSILGD